MNRWAHMRLSRIIRVSLAVLLLAGALLSSGSLPLRAESNIQFETTLGHFAAYSDSVPRSKVNVWIDGQPAASELAYLQQAESLTLDEGTHEIVVAPFEWSGGTITRTFELPVSGTPPLQGMGAVLAIIGGTSGVPLGVLAQVIERTPPAQGARARLTNLALFAPGGTQSTRSAMRTVRRFLAWKWLDLASQANIPTYRTAYIRFISRARSMVAATT